MLAETQLAKQSLAGCHDAKYRETHSMEDNFCSLLRNRWVWLLLAIVTMPLAVELEAATRGTGFAANWQGAIALLGTGLIGIYLLTRVGRD